MKQLAIWAWIIVILVLTGAIVPGLVIIGAYTVLLLSCSYSRGTGSINFWGFETTLINMYGLRLRLV